MLFAITVLCFVGILWAALALARYIKSSPRRHNRTSSAPFSIIPRTSAPAPTEKKAPGPKHVQHDFRHHFLTAPADVPARNTRQPLNQSVHDIAANKQWTLPPHGTNIHRLPLRTIAAAIVSTVDSAVPPAAPDRKPTQPARNGRLELLDPAYFNKEMGNLSDPTQSNSFRATDRAPMNRY